LSGDELAQLLPSELQPLFTNQIAWAKSHLKAAGLIESPRRGYYKIRPRGLQVLKANPSRVDLRVLNQFPGYLEFRTPKNDVGESKSSSVPQNLTETDRTPEDHLEYGYQRVREQLAADLLAKVKDGSPFSLKNSSWSFWQRWVMADRGKMPVARSVWVGAQDRQEEKATI
jgi:restriction system protein